MYRRYPVKLGRLVSKAADESIAMWKEGRRPEEPEISASFLTLVESRLDGQSIDSVSVRACVYKSHVAGEGENITGADFGSLLDINFEHFQVQKAFLAQAKKVGPGEDLTGRLLSDRHLEAQCEKMLARTPASFVFVYTHDGVSVLPALDVHRLLRCARPRPAVWLHRKNVGSFYAEFFRTFVGDHRIVEAVGDDTALEEFAREYAVSRVLYVGLEAAGPR